MMESTADGGGGDGGAAAAAAATPASTAATANGSGSSGTDNKASSLLASLTGGDVDAPPTAAGTPSTADSVPEGSGTTDGPSMTRGGKGDEHGAAAAPAPAPAAAAPPASSASASAPTPAPGPPSDPLFGTDNDGEGEGESDLFGSIPSSNPKPTSSTTTTGTGTGLTGSTLLSSSGLLSDLTSTLTGDGGTGAGGGGAGGGGGVVGRNDSGGGGGGGLFDEVDAAEERERIAREEKAKAEAEERARVQREREEAERLERERVAQAQAQAQAEEERKQREAQLAQQQQQAQQQQAQAQLQQMQGGMQNINLNGGRETSVGSTGSAGDMMFQTQTLGPPATAAGDGGFYRQQQPQMQQPQPSPQQQTTGGGGSSSSSSFLERSQQLQQQAQAAQQAHVAQQQAQMQAQQQNAQAINAGYGGASYYYSTAGGGQQNNQMGTGQGEQPQMGQPPMQHGQQGQQQMGQGQVQGPPGSQQQDSLMHGRYYGTGVQPQPQPGMPQPGMMQQQQQQPHPLAGMGQTALQHAQTPHPQPSVLAGLHCGSDPSVGGMPNSTGIGQQHTGQPGQPGHAGEHSNNIRINLPPPPPYEPLYGHISVSDPLLVQDAGFFAGPPHWTYAVGTRTVGAPKNSVPGTSIRRRFRHFVALEDRLRETCLGAILPARPDKHPTRAIEEASASQSAQFAMQRSQELENYLNSLVDHPIAGRSPVLRLFLTLQDDIGTAWPEVSSSALTRLGAVSTNAAVKVAEGTSNAIQDIQKDQQAAGEDNAELLALAASEGVRIGNVVQAVPKIDGAISLIREQGERAGITGMEMSKLAKDVQGNDPELSAPLELLSSALLRNGRRTKRLALELNAAAAPFVFQYKLCRYERMAFADRRAALKKRTAARGKANSHAQKLMMQQHQISAMGHHEQLGRMEMQAAMTDEYAVASVREADEVGLTLQREVARVANTRLIEWSASIRVLASSMKEACAERAAIWEGAREQFRTDFPDFNAPPLETSGGGGPMPAPVAS